MEDMKKPHSAKTHEKIRAFTVEEQKRLHKILTTEDVKYSQQMLLSMLTGMRMGEINALEVKDINLGFKTISVDKTISKGKKGEAFVSKTPKTESGNRLISISDAALPLVKEILFCKASQTNIFLRKEKLITTSQVNMQLQRVLKKYDILDKSVKGKVSLHSLRHTFATRCIEAGMQPKVLQHILGHSDTSITLNTYCDAFDNFQKENMQKSDEYLSKLGIKCSFPEEIVGA